MLIITPEAVDGIKAVMGSREGGLKIAAAPVVTNGHGPGLSLEAVPEPESDDAVVEADGAQLYLDPAAAGVLDGKILDAEREGDAVRFSIVEPG